MLKNAILDAKIYESFAKIWRNFDKILKLKILSNSGPRRLRPPGDEQRRGGAWAERAGVRRRPCVLALLEGAEWVLRRFIVDQRGHPCISIIGSHFLVQIFSNVLNVWSVHVHWNDMKRLSSWNYSNWRLRFVSAKFYTIGLLQWTFENDADVDVREKFDY